LTERQAALAESDADIAGGWESSRDGHNWDVDFQLNYVRLA
jgi:hypothetical protein